MNMPYDAAQRDLLHGAGLDVDRFDEEAAVLPEGCDSVHSVDEREAEDYAEHALLRTLSLPGCRVRMIGSLLSVEF